MTSPEQNVQWYEKVPTLLSPKNREALHNLRNFFLERPKPQNWYYPCAGADNLPIFIAPRLTTHWFVDSGYDASKDREYEYTARKLADNFVKPFERLGAKVKCTLPWEAALDQGRQTVIIGSDTRIELVGADIDSEQTVPRPYGVIYNNDYMGMQIPGEFVELATGGLYVCATGYDFDDSLKLTNYGGILPEKLSGATLADFGLIKRTTFAVEDFSLPGIDVIETVPEGTMVFFQIFEKTRPFTEEENAILKQAA